MIAKRLLKILKNLRRSGAIALLASWAIVAGLDGRSFEAHAQAITPPWVVGPAATPCSAAPGRIGAIVPLPLSLETGKPFTIEYRGGFSVDQFFIESVPGGFRVNVRGTETGAPLARCYILQSSLLIAPSGNFVVEDALFRDGPFGYASNPLVTRYPFTAAPAPAPAPTLGAVGLFLLAAVVALLTRRHFRAAAVLLIFQLIAPPLWRFHI
jgi:hypothetical protein